MAWSWSILHICFTEDATVALFCKAYKSMIKPFEADLSHGRVFQSLILLYCQRFLGHIRRRTRTYASLHGVFAVEEMSTTLGLGLRLSATSGQDSNLLDVWKMRSSSKVTQSTIDNNVFPQLLSSTLPDLQPP